MKIKDIQTYLHGVVHDTDINIFNVNNVPFNINLCYNFYYDKKSRKLFEEYSDCLFHAPDDGTDYSINWIFGKNEGVLGKIEFLLYDVWNDLEKRLSTPLYLDLLNIQKHKSFKDALEGLHKIPIDSDYKEKHFTSKRLKLPSNNLDLRNNTYCLNGLQYRIMNVQKMKNNSSVKFIIDEASPYRIIALWIKIIEYFREIIVMWLNKFYQFVDADKTINFYPIEINPKIKLEIKNKTELIPIIDPIISGQEKRVTPHKITDWSQLEITVYNNNRIIEKINGKKAPPISPDSFGFLLGGVDWKRFCKISENAKNDKSFIDGRRQHKSNIAKIFENRYTLEKPFGRKSKTTGKFSVKFKLSWDED
jgi:hypothetical protein